MSDLAETVRRIARRERWPASGAEQRHYLERIAVDPRSRWLAVRKIPEAPRFMVVFRLHGALGQPPEAGPAEGRRCRRPAKTAGEPRGEPT